MDRKSISFRPFKCLSDKVSHIFLMWQELGILEFSTGCNIIFMKLRMILFFLERVSIRRAPSTCTGNLDTAQVSHAVMMMRHFQNTKLLPNTQLLKVVWLLGLFSCHPAAVSKYPMSAVFAQTVKNTQPSPNKELSSPLSLLVPPPLSSRPYRVSRHTGWLSTT